MNAKAAALGMTDTHFVRPDGLDAPGAYSSARDVTVLAERAMRVPFVRQTVRQMHGGDQRRAARSSTWNDLLGVFPGVIGVKTGHTNDAGWSQVAAVRADVGTIYATILGSPSRAQRNADLQTLLAWGVSRYRVVEADRRRPHLRRGEAAVRPRRGRARRGEAAAARRPAGPAARREGGRARSRSSCRCARGQPVGRVEIWSGTTLLGRRAARRLEGRRPAGRRRRG